MPPQLSLKDIHFIQPLFWHSGWFSVTPWYDFHTCTITNANLAKLYGLLLIFLRILPFIYSASDEIMQKMFDKFLLTQQIFVFVITFTSMALNTLTTLKVCLFDASLWTKMLTNLQSLDTKLKNIGKVENRILKKFNVLLVLLHVGFAISTATAVYVWTKALDMPGWKVLLFSGSLEIYSEFLLVVILVTFVRVFRIRYNDLNERLKASFRRDKLVPEVKLLVQNYRLLGETVDTFNKIFGYQIVLIIFHSGSQTILCFNTVSVLIMTEAGADFHCAILVANIWVLCWISYAFLVIVFEMSSTVQESRKFVDSLYKLQDELLETSAEMAVVKRLIGYSKNFRRGFSGAEFFSINKGVVFSVMGTVATYLIISLQLNGSQNQKLATGN